MRPAPAALRDDDLRAALALREAIYRAAHDHLGDRGLARSAVATINSFAAHPDPVPRLTAAGWIAFGSDQPAAAALSLIARDAIELLTGAAAGRLRECAAPDCAFLFVDTSRAGRRRWCAMDRCGNRQHVREHRRRRRLP